LTPENRIPELDFFRGFCILAMIAVHLIYDLTEIYRIFPSYPPAVLFLKDWGAIAFFMLSAICATLGRSSLRRGLTVLSCAVLVSAVTGAAGSPVRFGVLHCLGSCMVLWVWFRKLPQTMLLYLALASVAAGAVFERLAVSVPFLYPLGLISSDFSSADFFPLFPYFGYFLAGTCFGRRFYTSRRSLLPMLPFTGKVSRVFRFCGRHALSLYLLHQPFLLSAIEAVLFLRRKLP